MVSVNPAADEMLRMETRDASPAHFLFKIESFSLLDKCGIDKYVTKEFVAGKYKWRLIIYPNGDDIVGKDGDYISVYLAMVNTNSLPSNWEVNAVFNIFIYNQIAGNYLCSGQTRRFHAMKAEWGISKFISKKFVSDPSKGYLVNDNCVFGAEVFVLKSEAVTECLSLKNVNIPTRGWSFTNFSKRVGVSKTEKFSAGGHEWKILFYPKGDQEATGRYVSVYLINVTPKMSESVKATYSIWIRNQLVSGQPIKKNGTAWFTATSPSWGWTSFVELATVNDPNKGFVVKDTCILYIDLSIQAIAKGSPSSI